MITRESWLEYSEYSIWLGGYDVPDDDLQQ